MDLVAQPDRVWLPVHASVRSATDAAPLFSGEFTWKVASGLTMVIAAAAAVYAATRAATAPVGVAIGMFLCAFAVAFLPIFSVCGLAGLKGRRTAARQLVRDRRKPWRAAWEDREHRARDGSDDHLMFAVALVSDSAAGERLLLIAYQMTVSGVLQGSAVLDEACPSDDHTATERAVELAALAAELEEASATSRQSRLDAIRVGIGGTSTA
jgi:hypothetical protein